MSVSFLTNAGTLPPVSQPAIAVATDDVNVFTRLSRDERFAIDEPPLHVLDKVWMDWGLEPKPGKCTDLQRSGVMLGVALSNGVHLWPQNRSVWARWLLG